MGLRLWIKTKDEPVFTLRTQWLYLNQSYELEKNNTYWFFQDEWSEDFTLFSVAGYVKDDAHGNFTRTYVKHPKEMVEKMASVTSSQIDQHFVDSWERNTPFWDFHRILAISYLEAKRDYLKSLISATITDIKTPFDIDDPTTLYDLPCWYEYRCTGPAKILERIPGKVTKL